MEDEGKCVCFPSFLHHLLQCRLRSLPSGPNTDLGREGTKQLLNTPPPYNKALLHLIPTATLQLGVPHPHFTDEQTEAQRFKNLPEATELGSNQARAQT